MRLIFKSWRIMLTILFVIVGIVGCLIISNRDYLINGGSQAQVVNEKNIDLANWFRDKEFYISQTDPQIIINNINGYVEYVDIFLSISEIVPVKIYYTTSANLTFSEENSFLPDVQFTEDSLLIHINKDVRSLRIDLGDEAGLNIALHSIRVFPLIFTIDILSITMYAGIMLLISLIFYFPMKSWVSIFAYIQGFKKYSFLLVNLVKKDITLKYRRSVLGILWSVLNPLLMMIVITAVFQKLFRFDIQNFPLYYLTGLLVFNFVSEATSGAMTSIIASASLIKKVYTPKFIFPIEKCLFALVNMVFSMIAVLIIFFALRINPPWTMILFPIPMIYAFIFSVGIGMILSTLNVFFRDISHLYSVWITAWMYLTPIIYPVEILPSKIRTIVELNPMYYYVDYLRQVVLYGTVPDIRSNMICLFFSAFFFIVGFFVFKKKQDRFILFI